MRAQDYKEQFTINPITFTPKAKRCGASGCTRCPHPGYWYAYIPSSTTTNGQKVDGLYLGRSWDGDRLKALAAQLCAPHREQYMTALQRILDRERLEAIEREMAKTERDVTECKRWHKAEVDRLERNHANQLIHYSRQLAQLTKESRALVKQLQGQLKK